MKITIAGIGYVGLSNAVLLAQNNEVIALDIIKEKVEMINNRISPIIDKEIEEYLATKQLNLIATTDSYLAYKEADYVIVSTPTNYDIQKNYFDTKTVEAVISSVLSINPDAVMIIKSTVPVGYTEVIKKKFDTDNKQIYLSKLNDSLAKAVLNMNSMTNIKRKMKTLDL